ncbi:hypothetical protein [Flavobacterium cauense]|nr:hypothetical protein [Flavobacterium cauense]
MMKAKYTNRNPNTKIEKLNFLEINELKKVLQEIDVSILELQKYVYLCTHLLKQLLVL